MRARAGSEESGYEITRDFVVAMLEHFKAQKVIHRRFAFQIILQACGPRAVAHCMCMPHVSQALPPCTNAPDASPPLAVAATAGVLGRQHRTKMRAAVVDPATVIGTQAWSSR